MAWHFLLCTNPVSKKTLSYRTITLSDTLLALVSRACVLIVDMALMWVFDKKAGTMETTGDGEFDPFGNFERAKWEKRKSSPVHLIFRGDVLMALGSRNNPELKGLLLQEPNTHHKHRKQEIFANWKYVASKSLYHVTDWRCCVHVKYSL